MYWPFGIPSVHTVPSIPYEPIASSVDAFEEGAVDGVDQGPCSDAKLDAGDDILDIDASRTGEVFATITQCSLSIWQTKPTAVLATVIRSSQSLTIHGRNRSVHLQPDASCVTLRTAHGTLITYALHFIVDACVYQIRSRSALLGANGHRRSQLSPEYEHGPGDGQGIRKLTVVHQTTLTVETLIEAVVVLDGEILISSRGFKGLLRLVLIDVDETPSRIEPVVSFSELTWIEDTTEVVSMSYDRPMRLHVWLTKDGRCYAVRREAASSAQDNEAEELATSTFTGFCFHDPTSPLDKSIVTAINARFSMIAVGCADSSINLYHAKDYTTSIALIRKLRLPTTETTHGRLLCLRYSPDGYALFAGFSKGWAMFSVYGKLGANSFGANHDAAQMPTQQWLLSVRKAFWTVGGTGLVFLGEPKRRIYAVECVRSSVASCFNMANVSSMILHTGTSILLHRGLGDMSEPATSMIGSSVWQTVPLPPAFLSRQWPVRCSVISPDGNYLAVAGRRGIAHYSVSSGRWRTFDDIDDEDEYVIRGGMCWYQHVLIAAVDADRSFEVRLYSREKQLSRSNTMHTVYLDHAVIHMAVTGDDSLLIYTHENMLHHFIFVVDQKDNTVRLEQVGKIGFHGIIRAPSRVRAMNWVVPDEQRENGFPSQDVAKASVIFLIDAKLVVLRPTADEEGAPRYDMRVIAHNVEYYLMTRQTLPARTTSTGLSDALMVFNGKSMLIWPDLVKVLDSTALDVDEDLPKAVVMTPDFYPLSAVIETGVLAGIEPEIVQRDDAGFAHCRLKSRTHLAIPGLLRHLLDSYDSPSALHMCEAYRELPYFAHSLEMLLHTLLDEQAHDDSESEHDGQLTGESILPSVLTFMSSFPCYLDVIVGCTRKTDMRTWQTLFKCLPPVVQLFEDTLLRGSLKTAGGLLLVLHNFDEKSFNSTLIARLLTAASKAGDWDLCKELARFLVGIDDSGRLLQDTLSEAELKPTP